MKKRIIASMLGLTLAVFLAACGGSSEPAPEPEEPAVTEEAEAQAPASDAIVLSWDDPGEYGQEITLNAGTADASTYYGFYIPSGTYSVTNNGSGAVQVTVYKDGTNTTEEGWEEPVMGDASPLVVMEGDTGSITVGENEYVKLSDGSADVEFVPAD